MRYADALDAFFAVPAAPGTPIPLAGASPARRLRDAVEPLAAHGIWAAEVNTGYETLGLNFLTGYVWGRAAALGTPSPSMVTAAFGVFAPSLVESVYAEAVATARREDVLGVRERGTVASLHRILGAASVHSDDVAEVLTPLRAAASAGDGAGRSLYSGLAGLPEPVDPFGALWRACELLREHRGDGHLAVCVAAGLDAVAMNLLTELYCGMPLGSYTATRGFSTEQISASAGRLEAAGLIAGGALSARGEAFRNGLELQTDSIEANIVAALGADLDRVCEQLTSWGQLVIDARGFPPDPGKRAAG